MGWRKLVGLTMFLLLIQLSSAKEEKVIMGDSECIKVVGKNYVRWYCYPRHAATTTTTLSLTSTTLATPIHQTSTSTAFWTTTSTAFQHTTSTKSIFTTSTPIYSTTTSITTTTADSPQASNSTGVQQTTTSTSSPEFPKLPAFSESVERVSTRSISRAPEPAFGEAVIQFNYAGWNLFSLPRTPLPPLSASTLLSSHTDCKNGSRLGLRVFQWNAGKQAYEVLENHSLLETGVGYWIKVAGPCKIFFQGTTFDSSSLTPYQLKPGFNLIGASSQAVSFEEFAGECIKANSPVGMRSFRGPYFFDTSQYQYNLSSYLEPGRGYFVFVNSSCTLKPKPCMRFPPAINISPSIGSSQAGEALNYSIAVANNDENCGETAYSLSASVPSNWKYVFSRDSVSIPANRSASITLSVFSPSDAVSGKNYSFEVVANSSNGATGRATGFYEVRCSSGVGIEVQSVFEAGVSGLYSLYSVSLKKVASCAQKAVSLSAVVPQNWVYWLNNQSIDLSENPSVLLVVGSSKDAAIGSYNLFLKIQEASGAIVGEKQFVHEIKSKCIKNRPLVLIKPETRSGPAGQEAGYVARVFDTDYNDCGTTEYSLNAVAPSGWSNSLNPLSISLLPGNSADAFVSITSPSGTPRGAYEFFVKASSSSSMASSSRSLIEPYSESSSFGTGVYEILGESFSSSQKMGVSSVEEKAFVSPKGVYFVRRDGVYVKSKGFYKKLVDYSRTRSGCERRHPGITLIPPSRQAGYVGQEKIFYFTITNNDAYACGASNFVWGVSLLGYWDYRYYPPDLVFLKPGESKTAGVGLIPKPGISKGTYEFLVDALNWDHPPSGPNPNDKPIYYEVLGGGAYTTTTSTTTTTYVYTTMTNYYTTTTIPQFTTTTYQPPACTSSFCDGDLRYYNGYRDSSDGMCTYQTELCPGGCSASSCNPRPIPSGDSDGDYFTDEEEERIGSNPFNAGETPLTRISSMSSSTYEAIRNPGAIFSLINPLAVFRTASDQPKAEPWPFLEGVIKGFVFGAEDTVISLAQLIPTLAGGVNALITNQVVLETSTPEVVAALQEASNEFQNDPFIVTGYTVNDLTEQGDSMPKLSTDEKYAEDHNAGFAMGALIFQIVPLSEVGKIGKIKIVSKYASYAGNMKKMFNAVKAGEKIQLAVHKIKPIKIVAGSRTLKLPKELPLILQKGSLDKNFGLEKILQKHGQQFRDIFESSASKLSDEDILKIVNEVSSRPERAFITTQGEIDYRFYKTITVNGRTASVRVASSFTKAEEIGILSAFPDPSFPNNIGRDWVEIEIR